MYRALLGWMFKPWELRPSSLVLLCECRALIGSKPFYPATLGDQVTKIRSRVYSDCGSKVLKYSFYVCIAGQMHTV